MSEPGTAATSGSRRTMAEVEAEIVAEMAGLDDPLARYEYLVRRGRELEAPEPSIRVDEFAVPGCESRVWIRARPADGRLRLSADAEAMITRGIVALLLRVLNDRKPAEILAADLGFLDRTGLRTHLSPARANGLAEMVRRIRQHAEAATSSRR